MLYRMPVVLTRAWGAALDLKAVTFHWALLPTEGVPIGIGRPQTPNSLERYKNVNGFQRAASDFSYPARKQSND